MEKLKQFAKKFWNDEEGLGTLEMLLIAAVLIGIAIMFRGKITTWVENLLNNADDAVNNNSSIPTGAEGGE